DEERAEREEREPGERCPLLGRLTLPHEAAGPPRAPGLAPRARAARAEAAVLSARPHPVVPDVPPADPAAPLPAQGPARARAEGAEAMALSARLEAEIAELEPADRDAFLADLGLTESARARFIRASYALLDLVSFLTSGEDECRAWPIRRGTTALKAAGKVH